MRHVCFTQYSRRVCATHVYVSYVYRTRVNTTWVCHNIRAVHVTQMETRRVCVTQYTRHVCVTHVNVTYECHTYIIRDMCVKSILFHRWFLTFHVWRLTHKWFSTSRLLSRLDICEFPYTSALCRCSAEALVETRWEPRGTEQWFLLLAVSGLFYLTRKRCKIDNTIWLGIEEIGCSSQCFYITYWYCIGVTVIDTRAHPPPYYNLTEATHNQNMNMSRSMRLLWLWGERSHGRDPSFCTTKP